VFHYRRFTLRLHQTQPFAAVLDQILGAVREHAQLNGPIHFYLEDAPGHPSACQRLLDRIPECAAFVASRFPVHLSNFGGHWDMVNRPAESQALPDHILLTIARGIPEELPFGSVTMLFGPLSWTNGAPAAEAALRTPAPGKPPFSARFPAQTWIAPGVILQRMSTGTSNVTITEQLPAAEPEAGPAAGVLQLLDALGAPVTESVLSVPENHAITDYSALPPPTPAEVHARYRADLGRLIAALTLPNHLPDPNEILTAKREPLGQIRAVIVRSFADSGWRKAPGRLPPGSHLLSKMSPQGRLLVLSFDTGSWSRHVVTFLTLMSKQGAFRLLVPPDASLRGQWMTPNPRIFSQVLDNLRATVDYLERTWIADLERALGPEPDPAHSD
jgi:hypothetical protein